MSKKNVDYYLDQIRDTNARIAVESFYSYCRGKLLLEDLGVPSWKYAVSRLADYENYYRSRGETPKRNEQLIGSYEAWRGLGEG